MVQHQEHHDAAGLLDEWINRVANLPAEIAFMQEEIEQKDRQMAECLAIITKNDNAIQKWIRVNGSHAPNPKEESLSKVILENYDKCQILQEEKVALAQKTRQVMDKHTRWLDGHIKGLQERGEVPNDPDLPSLLRPQPESVISSRLDTSAVPMPLGPITNSATMVHTRHPNQYPQRIIPAHMQAPSVTGVSSSSAPATPAASMLMSRQARESSLGAPNKRQKMGLGVLPPSGLARQSSATPGTPRGHTPAVVAARAGSAGPKGAQKSIITKKVAPSGSRQAGAQKKLKKSGLSRLKRAGNKNSPSSTNDSELSDAESGSADEEDETATPPPHKDADGDEEMGDDEEGGDDKKYCMCQSVSYGDMVACDNEECPFEWFHWTCVGLKSEPVGTWICPVCTKAANKK